MRATSLVSCVFACLILFAANARAQQTVFLDFDSGSDGSIDYTQQMRDSIVNLFAGHFAPWNFTFTQTNPGGGPFSTITFNAGGGTGAAQHIDFRNLDKSDTAMVNVDGLGLVSQADLISASAIVGSHELGHLQGLRHGDSFGPIGSGVNSTPGNSAYLPDYPGPANAVETNSHLMASPSSTGASSSHLTTPGFFSERSATKLTFNEDGVVTPETGGAHGSIATAQALNLDSLLVPNTIVTGANAGAGPAFSVDAFAVTGEIGSSGELDFYSFEGAAGDLMNFEVISAVIDHRLTSSIDSEISIFDSTGTLVPYYSSTAFNDNEFESFDSIIIDLFLPADGTYFVQVNTFAGVGSGEYELFGYRFNGAVPEPSSGGLLILISMMSMAVSRRRRYS